MRAKRFVYIFATLTTVAIIVPLQNHAWALYAGACAGYTVLVFGLWRLKQKSRDPGSRVGIPHGNNLLTHTTFLAIVVGWVWFLIAMAPHVPYILRTEDTGRPYFGLAFIGILGLMLLEMVEQRWLREDSEPQSGSPHESYGGRGKP